jgi:hypothetical protein
MGVWCCVGDEVRSDKPKHVRVLWDIENIGISKKQGGLATVTRLQRYTLFICHIHDVVSQ